MAAAVLSLTSQAALAQDVRPTWAEPPDSEVLAAAVPPVARLLQIEGRVTVKCATTETGALVDCEVLTERPKNLGFGEGALAMTRHFRMNPAMRNGKPVRGTVRVPLVLKIAGGPPPSSTEARDQGAPPSAEALRLARRLLELQGWSHKELLLHALEMNLHSAGAPPEQVAALAAMAESAAAEAGQTAFDKQAKAYAGQVSVETLRAAVDFFKSKAGLELAAAGHLVAEELDAGGREGLEAVMTHVRRRLCELNDCAPPTEP